MRLVQKYITALKCSHTLVYCEGRVTVTFFKLADAHACSHQSWTSPAMICVTVFVVVVTLVVVIIVIGMAPTLSVIEIGGFFMICRFAGGPGLSRQ
jgi:hypothetical protein